MAKNLLCTLLYSFLTGFTILLQSDVKSVMREKVSTVIHCITLNPLSANPAKWSNTLKQSVGSLPTNCLSLFNHFVGLVLKGLMYILFSHDWFSYSILFE